MGSLQRPIDNPRIVGDHLKVRSLVLLQCRLLALPNPHQHCDKPTGL